MLESIDSNWDTRFIFGFWEGLQEAMGTKLIFSTTYHPQNGQSKRIIQILEDMSHVCVLDFKKGWEVHLLLIEFSYNHSF